MEKAREVFLFLSHSVSKEILKEYSRLCRATKGIGSTFFLYHVKSEKIPRRLTVHNFYLFSDKSLSTLKYPILGASSFTGMAHFPVLQFFRDNTGFEYYWVIEYDVRFSGDWRLLFDSLKDIKKDFLTCNIRGYADEPNWLWWALHHPEKSIPVSERLRSFNPIYRISKSSLSFLHQSLRDGWCGHNEVLLPTLLYHNEFTIMDIGGNGRFVPSGMENRFYTSSAPNAYGELRKGTMRYRPSFWRVGQQRNKLYHPVKSLSSIIREKIVICGRRFRRLMLDHMFE
jgi:hypothetical protein